MGISPTARRKGTVGRASQDEIAIVELHHDEGVQLDRLRTESRRQVDHNLDQGLITLSGEGTFRYSWRGYLFLWRQFLRDMVRLS